MQEEETARFYTWSKSNGASPSRQQPKELGGELLHLDLSADDAQPMEAARLSTCEARDPISKAQPIFSKVLFFFSSRCSPCSTPWQLCVHTVDKI